MCMGALCVRFLDRMQPDIDELEWDRQIEEDFSPGGRGMSLLAELEREIAEGKTWPVEEVCAKRKRAIAATATSESKATVS